MIRLRHRHLNTPRHRRLSAVPLTTAQKRPFKTLLGHRLVMNEDGQPMHKSDGTAIWFEEAAEQLGVDTMRWMYLAHNPSQDLRFGTRHKDKPVTIETPTAPPAKPSKESRSAKSSANPPTKSAAKS